MKYLISISMFVLYVQCISMGSFFLPEKVEIEESDSLISWSNSEKLTFDDFKGIPPTKFGADSLHTLAMTGTAFAYDYWSNEDGYVVNLECLFNRKRSWFRPMYRFSKRVLNHEQRHFDLAEVFVRKARKGLLDKKLEYLDYKILDSIMFSLDKELKVMQKKYDAEAGFLENVQMQSLWDLRIDSLLNASKKYDNIHISWETE